MKISDDELSRRCSTSEAEDEYDDFDRIAGEVGMDTIRVCHRKYEYPVDKIYDLCILEEEKGKDGVTRGGEVQERLRLNKEVIEILELANHEFNACPNKCRSFLIENKIIDYSSLHFAKILYTQPFGLLEKSQYLFNNKDEFAVSVREVFFSLFELRDITMKDLLLIMHTKVSPPLDSDKKQDYYQNFCEEYSIQNSHKSVNAENVMFMISSTFFVITDKSKGVKKGGISLEQY